MNYQIIYSNTKHGRIRLMEDGSLKLTIPNRKKNDLSFQESLLQKGLILIEKRKRKQSQRLITTYEDNIIIFGEKQKINGINGDISIFLKQKLFEEVKTMLDFYSEQIGINYNGLTIKDLKSKWGSCSHENKICINLKLVHLPLKFLKYVALHETCHLKEKNHSSKFWDLVESFDKDYKVIRKELKGIII